MRFTIAILSSLFASLVVGWAIGVIGGGIDTQRVAALLAFAITLWTFFRGSDDYPRF